MEVTPLVSVIIPTYNHAHCLGRALESVLAQSYGNWEAIVIDNHSSDNTDEVLSCFADPRIRVLKIHNHGVIAASRNAGIKAAKGEWIAFLDSDDWWDGGKLSVSMHLAAKGYDVLYHDLRIVSKEGQRFFFRRAKSRKLGTNAYRNLIAEGNALPNSSVVVRKILVDRVGGLSEDHDKIAWEDFDLWLRLAASGATFCMVPGRHGYYWLGGGNVSNPQRAISIASSFVRDYVGDGPVPWWIPYSVAVAHYSLGNNKDGCAAFFSAFLAQSSLFVKFRIVLRLLLAEARVHVIHSSDKK